jgi:YD repeat-containing protein
MKAGNSFEATITPRRERTHLLSRRPTLRQQRSDEQYSVEVSGSPASLSYDAAGDVLTRTDTTERGPTNGRFFNQLARVTKDGVEIARFKYDPLGRRVEKVAGATTTTWPMTAPTS